MKSMEKHATMDEPTNESQHPAWLVQTKRLFPHPLFAGCISLACLLVAILFVGVAIAGRIWPMLLASLIFLAGSFAAAAAALTKNVVPHSAHAGDSSHLQTNKPTFAILVLLVGIYSWVLTFAMHIFDAFIKNGPGSTKYYVTLGIAISSTIFMQVHGKRLVREHFGKMGGRNLLLESRQIKYVVAFILGCSFYMVWLGT